ncbi:MAG: pyrrolo-quinoline quinone [Sphingobacteriales bacterium]|nr:pyrrolo-quinoline quinone [Sphingobacteriales bacterium]
MKLKNLNPVKLKLSEKLTQTKILLIVLCGLTISFSSCNKSSSSSDYSTWSTYAGAKDGNRYSSNDQVNLKNVSQLEVAWTYSTADKDSANHSQIQCNPIVINGVLYGVSPALKLFAVDAATGKQKWVFDPAKEDTTITKDPNSVFGVSRGMMYWEDKEDKRIIYSAGSKMFAINAVSGEKVSGFGKNGFIDLKDNLDTEPDSNRYMSATSPGVIYKDLIIQGARVAETADAAPGHIRAFDVRTGQRRWIFHTIPHPNEPGYETWEDKEGYKKFGGANNWAGMSLDEKRGIVYVPTGSVGGDFYGGTRKGANLYSNSLIALDAETGKYLWHFQTVHHDLWDRDLAANPNLITLNQNGNKIDAVAQITKHGYIFMFDRTNGKPIFPIKETPVPQTNPLPGEQIWPTQPIPSLPEPFARQKFSPEDVTDLDPETHKDMLAEYLKVKNRAMFSPPSKEGGWIFPGFDGGGEWGGAAVDLESQILYINSSEMPWAQFMIDIPKNNSNDNSLAGRGKAIYNKQCIACHGAELKGNGSSIPSLVDLNTKYNEQQAKKIIQGGRNMMPAFKQIPEGELNALLTFLLKIPEKETVSSAARTQQVKQQGAGAEADNIPNKKSVLDNIPYTMDGYIRFLDKNGYPGIKPPWGTLNAVDLNSGKLLWKVALGEYPELTKKGMKPTGTENYGGPLVTRGGLVFIAATKDEKIRAFDKKSGKVVWEAQLPAAGYATPATYLLNGKQYIVIACGGGKIGSKSGDQYVAFALPNVKSN